MLIGVLLGAGRGHEATLQLAHRIFPDLRIRRDLVGGHRVERDAAGPVGDVVTVGAVALDQTPLLWSAVRCLRRGRRAERQGGSRNEAKPNSNSA